MTAAKRFISVCLDGGYSFWTGVPCTYLASLFEVFYSSRNGDNFHPALREDSACGLAVGAYLGGEYPVIAMQNSGFAAATNAIASLLIPYRIPAILVVSWRGAPGIDSQEHDVLGKGFPEMAGALGIPFLSLRKFNIDADTQLAIDKCKSEKIPIVLSVEKGVF